jgi:hypothetical protein
MIGPAHVCRWAVGADHDELAERQRIAEVQEQLDAQADGEGLAAEAGAGEETGLAEG